MDLEDLWYCYGLAVMYVANRTGKTAYIDICSESLAAPFDGVENVLSAQAGLVHHLAIVLTDLRNVGIGPIFHDAEAALAQNSDFAARDLILLQSFADNLLTLAH